MKNIIKYLIPSALLMLLSQGLHAQAESGMSNSKIEVVIGVIVIIFSVVVLYLIRLEKKINLLEKRNKEEQL